MQSNLTRPSQLHQQLPIWLWLGPLLYVFVVGIYFTGRFEGRWAESDSAAFTQFIAALERSGRLIPAEGAVYANGYAVPVISAYIIAITGLDVVTLQRLIYPLLAAIIALPAWLLFREFTGSARGATLASMILLTQPEFLFFILRSSHEKFTRTLMILCLFWLVRSYKARNNSRALAVNVSLFYLTSFAFIASNNLLAHSFIFAVTLALLLVRLLERRIPHPRQDNQVLQRLPYVAIICLGLVYLFTFYAYPPAQHDLLILRNVWERVVALFLDVETQASNPYTQVQAGWISLPVYLTVSIANWLLLISSVVIWLRQSWQWLWRGIAPETAQARLLWLFYGAFAFQGGLSIITDASGAFGNLQHRLFSSFSIVAAAVVGAALAQWHPRRMVLQARIGLTALVGCVAVLSLLKATNEPLLSNFWTFYRESEVKALEWSDDHLNYGYIWTEYNERLKMAFVTVTDKALSANYLTDSNNVFTGGIRQDWVRHIILTDVTRMHSIRLRRALPVPSDALQVYDNGYAQLYQVRPLTPYQR
jgi:hypothetical protein